MRQGSVYDGMDKEQTYKEHRAAFFDHIETPGVPPEIAGKAWDYHREVRAYYGKPVSSVEDYRVGTALSKRREEQRLRELEARRSLIAEVRQWVISLGVIGLVAERVISSFVR